MKMNAVREIVKGISAALGHALPPAVTYTRPLPRLIDDVSSRSNRGIWVSFKSVGLVFLVKICVQ